MSWVGGSQQGYVHEQSEKSKVSGCSHTWKLWRHCCCRYGFYPLFVAPLATAGGLLSIYSSVGCDFIRVTVGFTPSNQAWNDSSAEFGIFMYQSYEEDSNKYRETFIDGCRLYSDEFHQEFIEPDKTWEVTAIMAYVSAVSSIIGMITAWLFVITPLPASFFWPGFLLPTLMTAFLTEGSKFLIFDTSVCRNTAWFPSGADSLPRVAKECSLGETGLYCIASVIIFFICLILVCLRAPTKRTLEPFYGTDFEEEDYEGAAKFGNAEPPFQEGTPEAFEIGQDVSNGTVPRIISSSKQLQFSTPNSKSTYQQDFEEHNYGDDYSTQIGTTFEEDDLVGTRIKSLNSKDDSKCNPTKPEQQAQIPSGTISESRLSTLQNINKNALEEEDPEMIQKLVQELNVCFEMDDIPPKNTEQADPPKEEVAPTDAPWVSF